MNNLSHKKMIVFSFIALGLTFLSPITFGQIKKELNNKLNKINGKVEKISIQTDKGTVNFTGKEAEEILKKLKKKGNKFVLTVDDGSFFDDDNLFEIKSGKNGIKESVKVKEINGRKEITIKTTKDGKTTVKILRGKKAEEYLDKKNKNSKRLTWIGKDGKNVKIKVGKFKVDTNDKDVEKTIEVKIKDGKKEITVTTIRDGNKSVKIYKGKEADEFLKNHEDDDDITIDIEVKDSIGKTIIIKKEKKTDKDK